MSKRRESAKKNKTFFIKPSWHYFHIFSPAIPLFTHNRSVSLFHTLLLATLIVFALESFLRATSLFAKTGDRRRRRGAGKRHVYCFGRFCFGTKTIEKL